MSVFGLSVKVRVVKYLPRPNLSEPAGKRETATETRVCGAVLSVHGRSTPYPDPARAW